MAPPPPIYIAPGSAAAFVQPPSKEMLLIRDKCEVIWKTIEELRKHPAKAEMETALDFFGRIRALKGIVEILAKQPGFRDGDKRKEDAQKRLAPLKSKMDEIMTKLNTTVNLSDPLPYTAPKRVAWTEMQTGKLVDILFDPDNVKLLNAVAEDKNLTWSTKEVFFDWVGHHIHEALVEVVKTKKYEGRLLESILRTLDSRQKDTMIGACLWLGQAAASSGGNLPGPNSLYVGVVHLRAIAGFQELSKRGARAVLGDITEPWFEALRLSDKERTAFNDALKEFNDHHDVIAKTPQNPTRVQQMAAEEAQLRADGVYRDKLKPILKKDGSPQSGAALSGGMTLLNMVCLFMIWETLPPETTLKNWVDFGSAAATTTAGGLTSISRLLTEMKRNVTWFSKLAEHPYVGKGIGFVTAIISCAEGLAVFYEGWTKTKKDWWMIWSGGLQFSSGVVLLFAVLWGSPGGQLLGVVLGLAATAVAAIDDLTKEPMVEFLKQLLDKIKGARCLWDNSPVMTNVGLDSLISEFEALISSTGVSMIAYDHDWTVNRLPVGKDKVFDELNDMGITDGYLRAKLVTIASS